MVTQIFVVEDHPLMQKMLCEFIERLPGFAVCGTRQSAEEALAAIIDIMPDLILIDMSLPGMNGAELVSAIRRKWPELPTVLLSGHGEKIHVKQALEAGARGYIMKGKPNELQNALEQILAGEIYLSEGLRSYG